MTSTAVIVHNTDRRSVIANSWAAAFLVIALSCAHGLAPAFLYDAAQYWNGPSALIAGEGVIQAGALSIRGVLTAFVYFPPALLSSVLGPSSDFWTVLAWNSLLAAVVCVILLPRLAGLVAPGHVLVRIWVSAVIGGVVLSGFARYPLMDTWAVAIALAALYWLASGRRPITFVLAGLASAISINLRPAYIVPLILSMAIILIVRPRGIGWVMAGMLSGLIPQLVFNSVKYDALSIVPHDTSSLIGVQAAYAAWAIRYDTVLYEARAPQQWYCDPVYASQVAGDLTPTNQAGVVGSLVDNLPHSVWFLAEKAAASLRWSFSTPYEHGPVPAISPMWLLVIGVAALGIVALVARIVFAGQTRGRSASTLSLVGFWLGSLATLVLSTPETRFALPIIAIGIVGLLAAVPSSFRALRITRPLVVCILAIGVLVVTLFGIGQIATAHPAPAGQWTKASDCASF